MLLGLLAKYWHWQSKKWENDVLHGESSATSSLKGISTHSSIDNFDGESETISLHFRNSHLFQPDYEVSELISSITREKDRKLLPFVG